MSEETEEVIILKKHHVKQAMEVAGRAFENYPTNLHMFPDDKERKKKSKYGFNVILKYGLRHGIVHATTPDLEGVAVWLPPKRVHMSAWDALRCGGVYAMRKTGLRPLLRGLPIFNYLDPAHKKHAPFDHWYLQLLAVDPDEQGKGHGSKLLRAMFANIQKEKLPIYLETNKEINVEYYKNHGFKVLEHEIIPKTNVPIWCMLKKWS